MLQHSKPLKIHNSLTTGVNFMKPDIFLLHSSIVMIKKNGHLLYHVPL